MTKLRLNCNFAEMIKDFFMKKRSVFVLLMAVAATFMPVGAADWQQDVLGDGYVAKTI